MICYERSKVRFYFDWFYFGAVIAMWDVEGFVQVYVGDIDFVEFGLCDVNEGVEVGIVYVNLFPMLVDGFTDFCDGWFKNFVGGGVGDHQGGKVVGMFFGFFYEVGYVDVVFEIVLDDDYLYVLYCGVGGVGFVSGIGDQADFAVFFVLTLVVLVNHQQVCVLVLCIGIRLYVDYVKTCKLAEHVF